MIQGQPGYVLQYSRTRINRKRCGAVKNGKCKAIEGKEITTDGFRGTTDFYAQTYPQHPWVCESHPWLKLTLRDSSAPTAHAQVHRQRFRHALRRVRIICGKEIPTDGFRGTTDFYAQTYPQHPWVCESHPWLKLTRRDSSAPTARAQVRRQRFRHALRRVRIVFGTEIPTDGFRRPTDFYAQTYPQHPWVCDSHPWLNLTLPDSSAPTAHAQVHRQRLRHALRLARGICGNEIPTDGFRRPTDFYAQTYSQHPWSRDSHPWLNLTRPDSSAPTARAQVHRQRFRHALRPVRGRSPRPHGL